MIAESLMWGCAGVVGYTYALYPLAIAALGALRRRRPRPGRPNGDPPRVAVIVPVHNGREFIAAKLASLRAQTYPVDRVSLIFVSDGSDDGTVEALEREPGVRLVVVPERTGKPHAINQGVLAAGEQVEILVMTDIRQRLSKNALEALVAVLADPQIGVAGGELELEGGDGQAAQIGLYWRYEKWIRRNETRVHSTAGASGALYALRREDFEPLAPDTLLDDFEIPIAVLKKRKRIVLVPEAVAYDRAEEDIGAEKIRKIRTLSGNFQSFARHRWLFNPVANPIFVQFVSHKVLRLLVPYALLGLFAASIAVDGPLGTTLALAQLGFYAVAWLGANDPEFRRSNTLVKIICTFVELNWAAVIGMLHYLRGGHSVKWEQTR